MKVGASMQLEIVRVRFVPGARKLEGGIMTFYVGQKVVCVDAKPSRPNVVIGDLTEGTIYTVRWVGIHSHPEFGDAYCIRLSELVRRCEFYDIDDLPARACRFRPIVDRKSKVSFTIGADPDSESWDNRRKQKEGAR